MSNKKVWFITGAGRGMGVDIAKAALAAGHAVVATGRDTERCPRPWDSRRPAGRHAGRHEPRRRRGRGAGRGRPVRPHRRAGQQCRQLLRRLLRGADAGADRAAVGDEPHRPDERHPRGPAGDAQAALGAHHLDLLERRPRRLRVRDRLRRVEVRPRGLDGVAAGGGRAVRHPHHHRQPRLLPHGAPHGAVHELRRTVHRGLRRAPRAAASTYWKPRTGSSPATRPSSRRPWSRLRTRSRRHAASSPAPMPSPRPSRRSPTCRPTSPSTASHSSHSTSTMGCRLQQPWRRGSRPRPHIDTRSSTR